MLLQANPTLTPSQVEALLQDTAYRFGATNSYEPDPQNPGGQISFDKGAGLADMQAALDALGTAHDGGESAQGTPQVAITSPVDGTTNDGTATLTVTGTAGDGYVAPKAFVSQVVASGDGGDLSAPMAGAADVTGLTVLETSTGMRYTLGVRDLADVSPLGGDYVVRQVVNGAAFATEVAWSGTAATASTSTSATFNNAKATSLTVDRAANTISWTLPFAALGNPGPLSTAIKVYVQSYQQFSVDLAPGGVVVQSVVQPEYGFYGIRRPSLAPAPTTTVTLAVDGGVASPVTLIGTSPTYSWSTQVATSGLTDGQHLLTATVLTNGVAAATRTLSFLVQIPVVVASSVAVTNPAEGAALERGPVSVTGTAITNAPLSQVRRVTVQVTGAGYDSGELAADGTSSWSLPLDAGALVGGGYLLTARFSLDGTVVATATRAVTVPAAVVLVSCAPRGLSFWQEQYNGSRKAVFTTAEATALADKAAALSGGYFGSRSALVNVLYVKGKLPAETSAARQYAPLLLNLAAGQLSSTMGVQLGLSGAEVLDPSAYDTARVGSTVSAAATWIRGQLSGGDAAAAEQTAVLINTRSGLGC